MDEKQLLEAQKAKLRADLDDFKTEVIDVIKDKEKYSINYNEIGLYYGGRSLDLALIHNATAKKKYEAFVKEFAAESARIKAMEEALVDKRVQLNLEHNHISFETKLVHEAINKRDDDDEYEFSIYVDGNPVYTESSMSMKNRYISNFDMISCVERAIYEAERLENRYEEIRQYKQLKAQIASLGAPTSLIDKIKVSRLEREAKKLERYSMVSSYAKIHANMDVLKAFRQDYNKKKIDGTTIVEDEKAIKEAKNELSKKSETMGKKLGEISHDILAIKYATIYKRNFDILRMQKDGAKAALRRVIGHSEYYTDASIDKVANNIDEILLNYDIAAALHDDYRKKFFNPTTGTYTERWKPVKDIDFIKKFKGKELPSNLRVVDGKLEIDITNSSFEQLSLDWQAENYAAAKVAKQVAEKGYTEDMAGAVGSIIHDDNWLIRNEYAKGTDLDVPFADLTNVEKMKDLVQYTVAQRVIKEKQQKDESKSIM